MTTAPNPRTLNSQGFIVNRLLVPSLLQAMLMLDRKDATVRDIDLSLQLGAGHPMGPLHLADYIGRSLLWLCLVNAIPANECLTDH